MKILAVIGAALCAAGTYVASAGTPALALAPGEIIEHWGAYGTGGKPYDTLLSPVELTLPAPVAEIGSSNSTQYALLTDGSVWAWGMGTNGQLGNGQNDNSFGAAVRVEFPFGVRIASIATDVSPYNSALAIDTNGHAWAWGINRGGEFCLGNEKEYLTPVELPFSDVTALAGGAGHATYDAGGTLYSCGMDQYGELGDGGSHNSTTPVRVAGLNGADVTALVASYGDTGALTSNGEYYDWGYNAAGQVGNGTTVNADVPYQVRLPGRVTQASQGGSISSNGQTIVLMSSGAVYAWGNGQHGQLGNGSATNAESPVSVDPPNGVSYTAVASGGSTCYGITGSGAVYAWGQNNDGQVGDGTTRTAWRPVQVETGATGISATARDVVVSTS